MKQLCLSILFVLAAAKTFAMTAGNEFQNNFVYYEKFGDTRLINIFQNRSTFRFKVYSNEIRFSLNNDEYRYKDIFSTNRMYFDMNYYPEKYKASVKTHLGRFSVQAGLPVFFGAKYVVSGMKTGLFYSKANERIYASTAAHPLDLNFSRTRIGGFFKYKDLFLLRQTLFFTDRSINSSGHVLFAKTTAASGRFGYSNEFLSSNARILAHSDTGLLVRSNIDFMYDLFGIRHSGIIDWNIACGITKFSAAGRLDIGDYIDTDGFFLITSFLRKYTEPLDIEYNIDANFFRVGASYKWLKMDYYNVSFADAGTYQNTDNSVSGEMEVPYSSVGFLLAKIDFRKKIKRFNIEYRMMQYVPIYLKNRTGSSVAVSSTGSSSEKIIKFGGNFQTLRVVYEF